MKTTAEENASEQRHPPAQAVRSSAWLGDVDCVVREVTLVEVIKKDGSRAIVDNHSVFLSGSGQPLSVGEAASLVRGYLASGGGGRVWWKEFYDRGDVEYILRGWPESEPQP